jgi:tryptophanyl-tRNA synthetase
MAADILMFNANKVPVGRDQIQHLEMTRDIAQRFNHLYGAGQELFVLPEVQIDDDVATLPGLDGRKMSKSYDNTIPLFEGGAKALKSAIMRIVTDSRKPGEPKLAEESHIYTLYRAFATPAESADFRTQLEAGLGWGDAKTMLYERIEQELAPMRERYADFMAQPERLEDILQAGAMKARRLAQPFMAQLRLAVGLRAQADSVNRSTATAGKKPTAKRARFVSFRDETSRFRFRLLGADGFELLLSEPFDHPRAAGAAAQTLKDSFGSVATERDGMVVVHIDDTLVAQFDSDKLVQVRQAIESMHEE